MHVWKKLHSGLPSPTTPLQALTFNFLVPTWVIEKLCLATRGVVSRCQMEAIPIDTPASDTGGKTRQPI
ncbi:hypothetical protein BGX38DRAFT_1206420 [Terfezia claveryi]|nr:hypothetical protein BGX38DRAFT_1206420 [Terfezia claveryi]